MTGYFISFDQKIPESLIKVMLPGKVEAEIRSGINSRFDILGFSTRGIIV